MKKCDVSGIVHEIQVIANYAAAQVGEEIQSMVGGIEGHTQHIEQAHRYVELKSEAMRRLQKHLNECFGIIYLTDEDRARRVQTKMDEPSRIIE